MERTDRSENINELAGALAKAQGSFQEIEKNSTVKVKTKDGQNYEFKYADLTEIISKTRKALSENGLSFIQAQFFTEKFTGVETTLMHSSGQWRAVRVEIAQPFNTMQTLGSVLTYARRYCLSLTLGVAAEEDTDANDVDPRTQSFTRENKQAASGNSKSQQQNRTSQTPKLTRISEPQAKRLWAISTENNVSDSDMKSLIKGFGFDSSKDITTDKYDKICGAVVEIARKRELEQSGNQSSETNQHFTTEDIPF